MSLQEFCLTKILKMIFDQNLTIDQIQEKIFSNFTKTIEKYSNVNEKILFECLDNQWFVLFGILYQRYIHICGLKSVFEQNQNVDQEQNPEYPISIRLFEVACQTGQYQIIRSVFDIVFLTQKPFSLGLNKLMCLNHINKISIKYLIKKIIPKAIVKSEFDPILVDYMFALYSSIINIFDHCQLIKIVISLSLEVFLPRLPNAEITEDCPTEYTASYFMTFKWMPKYLRHSFSNDKENMIREINYQYNL